MSRLIFFILLLYSYSVGANYNKLNLYGLIMQAISYHPSIKSNIFLETSAKNDITSAKWQYFPIPKLSFNNAITSSSDSSYTGSSNVLIASLSQPLWAGGALDAGLDRARARLIMAKTATKVAKKELALKVINAYSRWYANYLKKEGYVKSSNEHKALLDRIKRRIKQGLSSSSDLELVSSRLTQVDAKLNSVIVKHTDSLLNLAELIGTPIKADDLVKDFIIIKFNDSDKKLLSRMALVIDPKIKKSQAESSSVKAELAQSRANLYPRLNLRLEHQQGNFFVKDTNSDTRAFIEVSTNFGSGLSGFSRVSQVKNRYRSILTRIKSEKSQIKKQITLEWLSYASLKKQKKLLESSLQNIRKIRNSWYRQFLSGRKTWQDVMNSVREVSQLEAQLADVEAERILISWRIFLRLQEKLSPVNFNNQSLIANYNKKMLWYPDIVKDKNQQSIANKVLNFVIPDNKQKTKTMWYFKVDNNKISNVVSSDNDFAGLVNNANNTNNLIKIK